METEKKWFILNIILPIIPLVLRGVIKILMGHLDFETINSSELFFVLGLIALLISQDLRVSEVPLLNRDKIEERTNRASDYLILFLIFVFLSACSEFINMDVNVGKSEKYLTGYYCLSILSFVCAYYTISLSIKTQKEFKLTSKFI